MLTAEENATFTQVGPGTPMGRLLRWYWHPIAAVSQLDENPVMRVRLLGETLVLYRDRKSGYGLIGDACAHRRVNLVFGIPEPEGLRCPYHGWLYDATGQCIQQPAEPEDSTFASRVKIPAYPVQELGGLIFAYLGPQPAPLLPRWDLMVADNVLRDVGFQVVPCNWLQMQENDLDPAHLGWLHGYFSQYVLERLGRPDLMRGNAGNARGANANGDGEGGQRQPTNRAPVGQWRDWEVYEQGLMNLERAPDGSKRVVRPSLFPNMNSFATQFMYRVPMDDGHTLHVTYTAYPQPPGEAIKQDKVPYYMVPDSVDNEMKPIWSELDSNGGQDIMAWVAQGEVVDRTAERLGESDKGIIMWRELLRRQLQIVEDGGEPLNVFRDPAANEFVVVPPRDGSPLAWGGPNIGFMRRVNSSYKHSPVVTELVERVNGKDALLTPVR